MNIEFLNNLKIHSGQIRRRDYCHNAGWYNKEGEKIGWGDLSIQDIHNIKNNLPEGEPFFILSERDSFWNFVTEIGTIGGLCKTDKTESSPGIDYVIEKFRYLIMNGNIYYDCTYRAPELNVEKIDRSKVKGLF